MVEEARRRVHDEDVADRVDVQHIGIHELDRLERAAVPFDAAYSNFGPLNCVVDLRAAARRIAGRLKPGGVLVASVIGRTCPWEIALYVARGDLARAVVRFRRGLVPVPLDEGTVWTQYFSPREFETIFAAAGFTRVSACSFRRRIFRRSPIGIAPSWRDCSAPRISAADGPCSAGGAITF